MLVKDAMNKNVKTARPDATVKEAAIEMSKYRIGSLVILSPNGEVIGIVTERDILDDVVATGKNSEDIKVEDIMTKDLITVSPNKTLEEAANLMTQHKIKKLPVVEEGRLVGIITASDLVGYEKELVKKVAELLMVSPLKSIGG